MNRDSNLWFTSDTHYGHKNICKGESDWTDKSGCRDFKTVAEMNEAIVTNINSVVKRGDTLIHLGDWSFGGKQNIHDFRRQLVCEDIQLVLGNHDHHIRNGVFTSLFTRVDELRITALFGKMMTLCHYPMRVWDKGYAGAWMLYGHCHGSLDDKKPTFPEPTWAGDNYYMKNSKSMDVGIDTHPEFRPYSYDEVKAIMDSREVLLNIDHHQPGITQG